MNWKKQAGMHLTWLIPQTKAVPLAGPPQPAGPSSGNLSVSRTFAFPSAELIIHLVPANRSGSVITIAYQHTRAFTEASESGTACLGGDWEKPNAITGLPVPLEATESR